MSGEHDYPSDDDLIRLREWPAEDLAGALDFAASLWDACMGSVRTELTADEAGVVKANKGEKFLRLATGGWSENEAVYSAMQGNLMLRVMCWQLSARGGLSIWEYPQR